MTILAPRRAVAFIAASVVVVLLAHGMIGCAKRAPEQPWPAYKPSPLAIVSESREQLPGGQASVKLVVRGDASPEAARDFLRDYVKLNRRDNEEMWVSLFLEGMDVQSIEYAFASARPGQRVQITVRESAQTYR